MAHRVLFASLALCGLGAGAALKPATLDRGGVTFDFAACSASRFRLDVPARENLVKGETCGGAGFETSVTLPDDQGGDYLVSCRYRMSQPADYRHEGHSNGGCRITFESAGTTAGSNAGKPIGRTLLNFLVTAGEPVEPAAAWAAGSACYPFVRTVSVPKGAKAMRLSMQIHKEGKLAFRDLAVVKAPPRPEAEIRLAVHGQIDSTYALPSGQVALVTFVMRRSPEARFNADKAVYRVTLPKGVRVVDSSFGNPATLKTERRADGSTVTTFARRHDSWIGRTWDVWDQRGLLLETADVPLGPLGEGRVVLTCEGADLAATDPIRFFAVPPIPKVKAPKRYFNGIDYGCSTSRQFSSDAAKRAYATFLADCGVKGIITTHDDRSAYDILHQCGVERVFPSYGQCCNGYMLARWNTDAPEDVRFVAENISPDDADYKRVKFRSVCPIAVYSGTEWFKTDFAKRLTDYLAGADGLWANWEPYMFINRGCFCLKCRAAFAAFLGIPEEELAKSWPKEVVRRYAKEWGRFRSREHGRLILAIDKVVRAATGGERSYGFLPGVEWADMSSCWRDENLAAQYRMDAYAGDLKWLEPWGPYAVEWESENPYFYLKHRPLAPFFAAADMRRQINKDYPLPRRPKIISYVQGVQGLGWIAQPESIALGLDSYFFNRWEAAMVYFFPKGCDARYWRWFAEATERAGKYERFVLDGAETTDRAKVSPIPEYATPCSYATRYGPWSRDAALLQCRAFDLNGMRIVAALNFWQKGEAFFDLKVSGLPKGAYRIVDEKGVLYAKNSRNAFWTAGELANGVRLMVGAMRTRVFEIVPKGADGVTKPESVITRAELEGLLRRRKDDLRKAAAEDARHEKANPTPPRDYMPMI